MIAMAGMFFSGDKTFMSFAIGTMMVVLVAMIGSLTVLPAVLAWLGDRVDKGEPVAIIHHNGPANVGEVQATFTFKPKPVKRGRLVIDRLGA